MRKTLLGKTVLLGLAFLSAAAVPVNAQPGGGYYLYEYTYYSDATRSVVVGTMTESCGTFATVNGTQTPYYTRTPSGYYSPNGECVDF